MDKLYLLLTLILVLAACKEAVPQLNKKDLEFAHSMANLYLANAAVEMIEIGNRDSARRVMITQALKITGTDTATFNAQLKKYGDDPRRLKIIYDSCTAILDRVQKQKLAE